MKLLNINVIDITGRPIKAWVMAGETTFSEEIKLKKWLKRAKKYVNLIATKKYNIQISFSHYSCEMIEQFFGFSI